MLDAFSRVVVGWATTAHVRTKTKLVLAALAMSLQRSRPAIGLICHSDCGCQYTTLAFAQQLEAARLVASAGAVGAAGQRHR